jgi:hypothetical protein
MDHDFKQAPQKHTEKKKGLGGNSMLLIILSCWLLFSVYMGSQGGG